MAKKKLIQLPKGYISYSQVVMWDKDRPRYEKIYFDGKDAKFTNSGMDYGKEVATALEEDEDTGDLLTDAAMLLLPKYDVRDQEIRAELKTKDGAIMVLGKPDTRDSISWAFREYKTGKAKSWTQRKAEKHVQMKFYAMLVYLASGKVLKEAWLDWVETEVIKSEMDGFPIQTVVPTGHVEHFRVPLALNDILEMMALTSRVAKEIEIAWIARSSGQQSGGLPALT